MTNDNRKVGTSFEQTLCRRLSDYGFWAHNLAQNKQGQPFDVIAARHGYTYCWNTLQSSAKTSYTGFAISASGRRHGF